jgi:monoamine oxidase
MEKNKVIIIGAGASGLLAAKLLKEKDDPFIVLESTDRLGGRAQTLEGHPHIELGPEFIHGQTPLTDELFEEYKIPYYDMQFDYHLFQDGELKPLPEFWKKVCSVVGEIKVPENDLSFADYLATLNGHSETDIKISEAFIQGFDAADLTKISSYALSEMKDQVCDPKVRRMRRPLNGYGELIEKMSSDLLPHIRFNHRVEEISWKKNEVTVKGTKGPTNLPFMYKGSKLLITVSVGVLKSLKISPRPRELDRFLEKVEMGQVVKVVAELKPEFFHLFRDHTFPFISSPDFSFSAWWTTTPVHTNTVTAWAGGEKARALKNLNEIELITIFIDELATMTLQSTADIKEWLLHHYTYDWNSDPSFLGAYSYPVVSDDHKAMTQTSFEDTLFFSGEAFHEEFSGTIEGALITGKEAIQKMAL